MRRVRQFNSNLTGASFYISNTRVYIYILTNVYIGVLLINIT